VRPVRVYTTRGGCVVTSEVEAVVVVSVGWGSASESLSTVGLVAGTGRVRSVCGLGQSHEVKSGP